MTLSTITPTNADKRAALDRDGFCRFDGIVPPELLEHLRETTDRMLQAQTEEERARMRSQGSMFKTNTDPLFADLIALPAALDALRSLGFSRVTFTDGYVISKPGGSPRLFWHYDWFGWQDARSYTLPAPQLFAMYYLSDTDRANGCLRAIPGSHLRHNPLHDLLGAPHSDALSQVQNPDAPEFSDRPDEVDVPVRAGDLLVGDARLLHAAHANGTDRRRTLITLWYQPDLGSLPPRLQAQMAAPGKLQRAPDSWPAEARARYDALLAHYDGDAAPYEPILYRPPDL